MDTNRHEIVADGQQVTKPAPFRRFLWLGFLSLLLAVGVVAFIIRSDEPVYQGKRLGEWLSELDINVPTPRGDAATKAVREIGTNAIPFILDYFHHPKGSLAYRINPLLAKIPSIKFKFTTANERLGRAGLGIQALGPAAKPAIPKLLALAESVREREPAQALASIGVDAIPALIACLTNRTEWVSCNAIDGITYAIFRKDLSHDEARVFIPFLVKLYESTNVNSRIGAAGLLGKICHEPDIVIPALIAGLADTKTFAARDVVSMIEAYAVKGSTLDALASYKNDAIPVLARLTTNSDPDIASLASNELVELERNTNTKR